MGLLDDYGVDVAADADTSGGFSTVEPGPYRFEVKDVFVKEGSVAEPEKAWIIFEYLLDDEMGKTVEHSELFQIPEDPKNPTDNERKTLGRYKSRLNDLGVADDKVNSVDRDELVGLTGTLTVVSVPGKGKNAGKSYQNIRNVKLDRGEATTSASAAAPAAARRPVTRTASANPFAS